MSNDVVRRVLFEHDCQRRGEDWLDRRQREKHEAREKEQRERQAREAKQQRSSSPWADWYHQLDARRVEVGDAVNAGDHGLAIDDELPVAVLQRALDDPGIAVGPDHCG